MPENKLQELIDAYRRLDMMFVPPCGHTRRLRLVDSIDGGRSMGQTTRAKKHFTILLDKTQALRSPALSALLLVHEMAHTLSWDETPDHGPLFGEAYAVLWSALVGEDIAWSKIFSLYY